VNELLRRLLLLPPQASGFARELDHLHYVVIGVTFVGSFVVFAAVVAFTVRYRRRNDRPRATWGRELSVAVELTVAGLLLALFVGFWWVGVGQMISRERPPAGGFVVYVTAKQWMWSFDYPNGGRSQDVLLVPTGRPVTLAMTSRDVIHSFYVPALRAKKDVVPGRMTELWFTVDVPGEYPIYCAEYCGLQHSRMRGRILALRPEDYAAAWQASPLAGRPPLLVSGVGAAAGVTTLARRGERVAAERGCLRCHTLDGSPHLGPTWLGLYGSSISLADGTTVLADGPYLTESMFDPEAKIRAGFPAIMPSYRGQLDPAETGALVELIRSVGSGGAVP
jgi:cytochrome c oxidase subunit 2